MAIISKEEVEHVAQLARLGLSAKEVEQYQKDLAAVLDYVAKLKEVDAKVPPTLTSARANVFRPDEDKRCDIPPAELLQNAPAKEGNHLKVKAVLEEAP